ncbi:3377_t:CDS:2, partial [Acaulospora colombiana]
VTSDEDEPSTATSRIKGSLSSGAFDASGQAVRIIDTHLDRILRNPHAEKLRLVEMIAGLTNLEPERLVGDTSPFQSNLKSGSVLTLSQDCKLWYSKETKLTSCLSRVVYKGDVQLAGPIALSRGLSALSLSQDNFDWSALKSEIHGTTFLHLLEDHLGSYFVLYTGPPLPLFSLKWHQLVSGGTHLGDQRTPQMKQIASIPWTRYYYLQTL